MKNLRSQRKSLGLRAIYVAVFVGINEDSYRDIENYNITDEAWKTLSLIQFTRLCYILKVDPSIFVPDDYKSESHSFLPIENPKLSNALPISLAHLMNSLAYDDGAIGCSLDAIKTWFKSGEDMAKIPVFILGDYCQFYSISVVNLLRLYLSEVEGINKR